MIKMLKKMKGKNQKFKISLGQQLESFSNAISVGWLHETSRSTNIVLI